MRVRIVLRSAISLVGLLLAAPASAELALSQLVVELPPASKASDVEVFNDSAERMFVVADPREILNAGMPDEQSRITPNPDDLGLLISPRRMILEPGQRRTLRVARLKPELAKERIFRVTVKPVVGDVTSSDSGLKLMVGYDVLVIARPATSRTDIVVSRSAKAVAISNRGNASVELGEGMRCSTEVKTCEPLPPKRLYAGASWQLNLAPNENGNYKVRTPDGWSEVKF